MEHKRYSHTVTLRFNVETDADTLEGITKMELVNAMNRVYDPVDIFESGNGRMIKNMKILETIHSFKRE